MVEVWSTDEVPLVCGFGSLSIVRRTCATQISSGGSAHGRWTEDLPGCTIEVDENEEVAVALVFRIAAAHTKSWAPWQARSGRERGAPTLARPFNSSVLTVRCPTWMRSGWRLR